ncbi:MAG: type I restriction endonuclease subunit R [Muribaculaceae bacterium]|nr:type I restriction endonuclease subunit R [Muribaculaceae bacterium]
MSNCDNPYYLPDFDEASSSQIPAIIQLINMGYTYIGRRDVDKMRESHGQYILRDIAFNALRAINDAAKISDNSIREAILDLEKIKMDDGIIKASEIVFSNLLAGVAVSEFIDGKKVSPQLRFIDWENPENNQFHVVPEFEISEEQNRRPDIVLFVNGIPFAVIENKKASVPVDAAIDQMIRNQSGNQTPRFFIYPQILIGTNVNELKYGTMLTPRKFYSVWKEKDKNNNFDANVLNSVNKPIDYNILKQISHDLLRGDYVQGQKQVPTSQDYGIYSLLEPVRMLDIVRNFVIYDNGVKKLPRYQQYFAIKKTLERIQNKDKNGKRQGGLIWHTQGSGKSLTMVMLTKNLIEHIQNPRIIVVTDRTDLDRQIRDTFQACNIKVGVQQATSCKDLIKRIKSKTTDVITTLIQKFEADRYKDTDNNIFVLIDEAHRTQGGEDNGNMNLILPNACQIAFTGTPLMTKKKRQTEEKFGGIIDSYTISEAEADGAILPLVYQGRFVEQSVSPIVDKFYERVSGSMTEQERKDFEKKCVSKAVLEETSQRIDMIAVDVHEHYTKFFQGTGLKGQLVAPSKYSAVLFKNAFDLLGGVQSAVVISDTKSGEEDKDKMPEQKAVVERYLQEQKRLYGSLESREKQIIQDFKKNPDGIELLIVVDKLLTGFDAPRDTVLYLAKQLKDHNLLQAIARVNRLFDGDDSKPAKANGLIVDYSKNAKNLKTALELFSNYDPDDVHRALLDTSEQIYILETLYQKLHAAFTDIKDATNTDAYVQKLLDPKNEEIKKEFYENVNNFIRTFSSCSCLYDFYEKFDEEKLKRYKLDLKRFVEIKKISQLVAGERVDFSKYKDQLKKLLDKYVTATDVEILSQEISLTNMREFNQFVEDEQNGLSKRSQAKAIAAQTSRVISERYKQDEVFYKNFSDRIKKLLEELRTAKQEDIASLFEQAKTLQSQVDNYEDSDIPSVLLAQKSTHAFFRNTWDAVIETGINRDDYADAIMHIVQIIQKHKIVDFESNISVRRAVLIEIEDFLMDDLAVPLRPEIAEHVAQKCWTLAVENREKL